MKLQWTNGSDETINVLRVQTRHEYASSPEWYLSVGPMIMSLRERAETQNAPMTGMETRELKRLEENTTLTEAEVWRWAQVSDTLLIGLQSTVLT